MAVNAMDMGSIPTVVELLNSPLAIFIYLAANDCGCNSSKKELICNWIHPLFLKAKSAASKEDNLGWREAMCDDFANKYWEPAKTEIKTLEGTYEFLGSWQANG